MFFSDCLTSLVTFFDKTFYYMTSDNVFSDWLKSLVTFFDNTLYSTRKKSRELNITFQRSSRHLKIEMVFPNYLKSSSQSSLKNKNSVKLFVINYPREQINVHILIQIYKNIHAISKFQCINYILMNNYFQIYYIMRVDLIVEKS